MKRNNNVEALLAVGVVLVGLGLLSMSFNNSKIVLFDFDDDEDDFEDDDDDDFILFSSGSKKKKKKKSDSEFFGKSGSFFGGWF